MRRLIDSILRALVQGLLRLRYRISVKGLDEIAARGTGKILFLPTHPALIDPIIVLSVLHRRFIPHVVADKDAMDFPVIMPLARRFGVRTILSIRRYGQEAVDQVEGVMSQTIEELKHGDNMLLYPAGQILRNQIEEIGANSAVERILREVPDARVVLLRTRGLWGSGFSMAYGTPQVGNFLLRAIGYILLNFIFFTPRRNVSLEFVEPADLPRDADRATLNRYLEDFYNTDPPQNTYVPYTIWERGGMRQLPEPVVHHIRGSVEDVPVATREIVFDYLKKLSGREKISDNDRLANDLGLDSLARAEMLVWMEKEFGFPMGGADAVKTVADALLAASGESVVTGEFSTVPPAANWFIQSAGNRRLNIPRGETITDVFLRQAAKHPNRVILADQTSGAKTYREVVTAVLALLPLVKQLEGDRIGIMLPASVAADLAYLAVLFAGKTPVMVNWTVGWRNIAHGLELTGVKHVITAQKLVTRVESLGTDLSGVKDRFLNLETLGGQITKGAKLRAWLAGRFNWSALRAAQAPEIAVILFTSGSESLPKAVPLTHGNLLTNLRDVFGMLALRENDRLLAMLPPFHSFGLTGNMLAAFCGGLRLVHYPNPTEGAQLAKLCEVYKVTLAIGTPTFISGIARAAAPGMLASLRLVVTGAEECPPRVYALLQERCPQVVVVEGYGITECSPIVAITNEDAPQPHTIGQLMPSLQHVILGVESGKPVPAGEAGILLLCGPSIFDGYLGDAPDPFVKYAGERWYRTGDLVSEDFDGVMTFRGRLKRFVKLGGEMVSLPAIESVLLDAYGTTTDDGPILAVVATPSEERPELVLFSTKLITREAANDCIRQAGLSGLHNIRQVVKVDELPLLGTGKTDYRTLQTRLKDDQAALPGM
ncbi:MAG: AMP-binding protein [Armatimonadota bacterium]